MTAVAPRRVPAGASLLDALGVAVCLADSRDEDAPVLYVNDAFEAQTGWTADVALGRSLEDVLGAAAGETTRPGQAVVPIRRRDGSSLRCELTVTEVPGPADEVACWAVVLVEFGEREQGADEAAIVETVLRVERDRAQTYLDVASALLVILYGDGTVGLLNRHGRQLLGDPAGELVGASWVDHVVAPEDRPAAREILTRLLAQGEGVEHYESDVLTRTGARRRIAWQVTSLADPRGRMVAVLSGQDITDRVRAEAQLRRLAFFDALTELPNRAQLESRPAELPSRARGGAIARWRCCSSTSTTSSSSTTRSATRPATGCCVASQAACAVPLCEGALLARTGGDEFMLLAGDLQRDRAETAAREAAERDRASTLEAVHRLRRRVPRRGEHRDLAVPGRRRRR